MKINEFKRPKSKKVNEDLASWIGDIPAAALKSFGTNKTSKMQMIQDVFLKDFISDATASLDSAVKSKFVSLGAESGTADKYTMLNKMAGGGQNSTTGAQNAPASGGAPKPDTGLGNKPQAGVSGGAPKPDTGLGNKPQAGVSGGAPTQQTAPVAAQNPAPKTPTPIQQRLARRNAPNIMAKVKESTDFDKLNRIFESIMEADEQSNAQTTISQYMMNWFAAYMQGSNWQNAKHQVEPIIKQIESSYKVDKGKAAIKQLAGTAFAIAKSSPQEPKGFENVAKTVAKPQAAATTDPKLKLIMDELAKLSPQQREQIKNMLNNIK